MARGNPAKLVVPTSREAREYGRKGGKKSGEVRRQRKAMRETLLELLQLPAKELEGMNNEEAGLVAMISRWHKGDVAAGVFIRDTIGEKPVDKSENKTEQSGTVTFHWARTEREA